MPKIENPTLAEEAREKELRSALDVYDVTLACLEPFIASEMKGLLQGQIHAAREAYQQVTGEEPLVLRRRA